MEVDIDGQVSRWHSLKGGINPLKTLTEVRKDDITYETFYNSQSHEWLKIVPPESTTNDYNPKLEVRLSRGVEIAKAALVEAGLTDLVDRLKLTLVKVRGKNVVGFVSPHIGPSIQFFYRQFQDQGIHPIPGEAAAFFSQVYTTAHEQAVHLYLNHEYWTADPNPGNVLVHQDPSGDIRVVIIDFTSRDQIRPFKYIPYPLTQEKKKRADLQLLRDKFRRQCQRLEIDLLE